MVCLLGVDFGSAQVFNPSAFDENGKKIKTARSWGF